MIALVFVLVVLAASVGLLVNHLVGLGRRLEIAQGALVSEQRKWERIRAEQPSEADRSLHALELQAAEHRVRLSQEFLDAALDARARTAARVPGGLVTYFAPTQSA